MLLEDKNAVIYRGSKEERLRHRKDLLWARGEGRPRGAPPRDGRRQRRALEERFDVSFVREIVPCYAREVVPSAKLLVLAAWLVVAMLATGPVAAQGPTTGARSADTCPGKAVSEQYGIECGTPSEGADAARDAADDSWRAAAGGAEAFGEAVEAAGVGNAPPAAAPTSAKEKFGLNVLPETGGIPMLPLVAGVLLTAGGLLGFGTASRRRPHRWSRRRGTG